jgi:hypothetical protein
MRISKILMLAGALFMLGAFAPASASAQCYYPGYGGGYYYPHHASFYYYPAYRPVHYHHPRHFHGSFHGSFHRRRYWR